MNRVKNTVCVRECACARVRAREIWLVRGEKRTLELGNIGGGDATTIFLSAFAGFNHPLTTSIEQCVFSSTFTYNYVWVFLTTARLAREWKMHQTASFRKLEERR